MSKARDEYYEFKKHADLHHEGLRDPIENYVRELEQEKAELLKFVQDIAYNDINKNDLTVIDWVQKEAWGLLGKHTEEVKG